MNRQIPVLRSDLKQNELTRPKLSEKPGEAAHLVELASTEERWLGMTTVGRCSHILRNVQQQQQQQHSPAT